MNPANDKTKALSKDETKCLISLVENSKIINNKTTNATTNKLKNEEWIRIAELFNSTNSTCRRTPQQLRMKWENLKKNSRKRNTMIRMNRLKTGGGAPSYIPPDEILDHVSSLLGSTADGFSVEFGGDAESEECESINGAAVVNLQDVETLEGQLEINSNIEIIEEVVIENNTITVTPNSKKSDPKKLCFPKSSGSGFKKTQKKDMEDGRKARNLAMADYYLAKKKCLEANYENLLLENEKLKLEIQELKRKSNVQEE